MSQRELLTEPPAEDSATDYDRLHLSDYLRLLDAEAQGADWQEVVRVVLGLDPAADPERAGRVHASHLARARWMRKSGHLDLLRQE